VRYIAPGRRNVDTITTFVVGIIGILGGILDGLRPIIREPGAHFGLLVALGLLVGGVGKDIHELQSTLTKQLDEKLTDLMKQVGQLQSELTEQLDQLRFQLRP
jgi:hypothetical protein